MSDPNVACEDTPRRYTACCQMLSDVIGYRQMLANTVRSVGGLPRQPCRLDLRQPPVFRVSGRVTMRVRVANTVTVMVRVGDRVRCGFAGQGDRGESKV